MKQTINRFISKLPSLRIVYSLFVVILVWSSLTGATFAWFTGYTKTVTNLFNLGTVSLSEPEVISSEQLEDTDEDKKCKQIVWEFENTGSKTSYVRVKPKAEATGVKYGTETAWVGVHEDDENFNRFGTRNWAQYYELDLNQHDIKNKLDSRIWASSDFIDKGSASSWVYQDELFIDLAIEESGWYMNEVHVYAGLEEPEEDTPGHLGFDDDDGEFSDSNREFSFSTDQIFKDWEDRARDREKIGIEELTGDLIYIVVHVGVQRMESEVVDIPVNIDVCPEKVDKWIESDGWWYYGKASNDQPQTVNPGEKIEVCFRYCVDDDYEDINMNTSLKVEAVQWSNYAVDHVWVEHPWSID